MSDVQAGSENEGYSNFWLFYKGKLCFNSTGFFGYPYFLDTPWYTMFLKKTLTCVCVCVFYMPFGEINQCFFKVGWGVIRRVKYLFSHQWLIVRWWVHSYNIFLVGGFNPSEKYESQMGWWHSQNMESHKIHIPNHQPDFINGFGKPISCVIVEGIWDK